jgi:hypothetical protein
MLAANMALEMQRLQFVSDGNEKARMWPELRIGLLALRRSELYAQRLEIEQTKHPQSEKKKKERQLTPEEKKERIMRILGVGPGYDGSINPELTRPPEFRDDPVQASTSQYK